MYKHITVLKEEAVKGLNIKPDGVYVDATLGGAGHSLSIASKLSSEGVLIGLDQDRQALEAGKERLNDVACRVILRKTNFRYLKQVVRELGFFTVDGILFDLGVSSPQLDQAERGFSYHDSAPLDMRMDQEQALTAYEIVNHWSEERLAEILWEYGEERFARRIAKRIVQARKKKPIRTTVELSQLIKEAIPAAARRTGPHPARRSFQAIRIAVNDELAALRDGLEAAVDLLHTGGRICVITFHSLEDRICKHFFREQAQGCICPKEIPVCVCHRKPNLRLITKKPILPTIAEIEKNARARSAKLRIVERC